MAIVRDAIRDMRGWVKRRMNKKTMLRDIIGTQLSEENFKRIEIWRLIYGGYFDEIIREDIFTINKGHHKRPRKHINMAKIATEELAKLTFTEKVQINLSDEQLNDYINVDVLDENRFYKEFKNKVEMMLAMGGGVLKANPIEESPGVYKMGITYVNPDCFIPISWTNGKIDEAVFINLTKKRDKTYILLEFHQWEEHYRQESEALEKVLVISNELYEVENFGNDSLLGMASTATDFNRVPLDYLYENLEERVVIEGIKRPIFSYIKTGATNNFDLESPLGISIYGNAIDTLGAINTIYDSFIREFKLGKRRIIVPVEALRVHIDPKTGEQVRYFDADDEAYVGLKFLDPESQKVMDNTVEIRAEEHIAGLNSMLNTLSMQLGFSSGTFVFDGRSFKTATEVVSENSKTYQTVLDTTNSLEESLIDFVFTLLDLSVLYDIISDYPEDLEVTISWDDSVVGDKYSDADYYIKMNAAGFISKRVAIMKQLGLTDEQAKEMLDEILEENKTFTPSIDDLLIQG